jgi:hypothetical protein
MPTTQGTLATKKDREDRRAKHSRLEINKKRGDFPAKAANTSSADDSEIVIAAKQMGRTIINQHTILIRPSRLREILTSPTAHQNVKNAIRSSIAPTGKNAINILYPLLLNQRAPNETELTPFPPPNEKIVAKLFDLMDVENADVITTPVALDDRYEVEWANLGARVFSSRKADFLGDEFRPTGLVPHKVSEATAQNMCAIYLRHGIKSLTFDFAGRRLRESWMRETIDSVGVPTWGNLLILGTNVPYFNWHGTFRNPTMAMYDLLTSVYGFDSFSGVSIGYGDEPEGIDRITKKIERKRYCLTETFGAYNKAGLETLLEQSRIRCNCPACRRLSTPLDLYDRDPTMSDLKALRDDLKMHRLHVTHGEMKGACSLIDKGKYHSHLSTKRAAANELQSILDAIGSSSP